MAEKRDRAWQARDHGGHCRATQPLLWNSAEFWTNLQSHYELRIERNALVEQFAAITPLNVA